MKRSLLLSVLLFVVITSLYSQSLNPNWDAELTKSVEEFKACDLTGGGCQEFLGKSFQTVYKVNDFYSSKTATYMATRDIPGFISTHKNWTKLGFAYDQSVLTQAQDLANAKKAVIAVYTDAQGTSHAAIILPGKLQPSGSWGLSVPNSASFFVKQQEKSYMDKSLAFAFVKTMLKDVVIYSRNY